MSEWRSWIGRWALAPALHFQTPWNLARKEVALRRTRHLLVPSPPRLTGGRKWKGRRTSVTRATTQAETHEARWLSGCVPQSFQAHSPQEVSQLQNGRGRATGPSRCKNWHGRLASFCSICSGRVVIFVSCIVSVSCLFNLAAPASASGLSLSVLPWLCDLFTGGKAIASRPAPFFKNFVGVVGIDEGMCSLAAVRSQRERCE